MPAAGPAPLADPRQIEALWRALRDQDRLRLAPEQLAAALRLLVEVTLWTGADRQERLLAMLLGVFGKSTQEQALCRQRFAELCGSGVVELAEPPLPPPTEPALVALGTLRRTNRSWRWAIAGMSCLVLAAIAVPFARRMEQRPVTAKTAAAGPTAPQPRSLPAAGAGADRLPVTIREHVLVPAYAETLVIPGWYRVAEAGLIALPMLMAAAVGYGWWRRQAVWGATAPIELRQRLEEAPFAAQEEAVWLKQDLRRSLKPLRTNPPEWTEELDIARTVQATAAHAGLFRPVPVGKTKGRGNIVLLEQLSVHDHLVQLYVRAGWQMRQDGIGVEMFGFSRAPNLLYPERGAPIRFSDLLPRARTDRLILIGTGDGLMDWEQNGPVKLLRDTLTPWAHKFLLSTRRLDDWGAVEEMLLQAGFTLGTATPKGLLALARAAEGVIAPRLLDVARVK